jgi:hypothetical protein
MSTNTSSRQDRLIYPDTWTLSALSRARRTESSRFEQFLKVWRETNSVLALSRTHLIELRRHRDRDARTERYRLLEALLPARFDMLLSVEQPTLNSLTDREIGVQVLRHLGKGAVLDAVDSSWVGFPLRIERVEELEELRGQLEDGELGQMFDLFYAGLQLGATVSARERGIAYERPRLGQLPDHRPTEQEVVNAMAAMRQQMKETPIWDLMRDKLNVDDIERAESAALDQMSAMLRRAQEIGFQEALREGDSHHQSRRNEFFDVHLQNRSFSDSVNSIVTALSGVSDQKVIAEHTRGVTRDGCPGLWLRDAVEVELRKAKPKPEPNDWFDLDHLTHLPYVTLQFADSELSAVTRQVLRRRERLPASVAGVRAPISSTASLEVIEAHVLAAVEQRTVEVDE